MLHPDGLLAFSAIAESGNFTRGAARIGITQSAISQRIQKLEDELGVTLLIRRRDQAQLTPEGEALLRYARACQGLESELLGGLRHGLDENGGQTGTLRVAGFSTITRSIVLPALTQLRLKSPRVSLHVCSRELRELPSMLRTCEADLVMTDREISELGVESVFLGNEENVLVETTRKQSRVAVGEQHLLDHDPDDTVTDQFARINKLSFAGRPRCYLDDIYGLIDGVALGWGQAVVPIHLVGKSSGLRIVPRCWLGPLADIWSSACGRAGPRFHQGPTSHRGGHHDGMRPRSAKKWPRRPGKRSFGEKLCLFYVVSARRQRVRENASRQLCTMWNTSACDR